jgi:spore maturation protein CgeB
VTTPLDIVLIGLSVTSSWGNGHATNYRGLMKELDRRGHRVTFLERDVEWYAAQRDLPQPPYGHTHLYGSVEELHDRHADVVHDADLVVVGSYVPDGIDVARWVTCHAAGVTAFYDIDTPVTLANLAAGTCSYLAPESIAEFDLYLSFTGGPTLGLLERRWGARRAEAFYCMVDEEAYAPAEVATDWTLGYLGTYSADRQPALDALLLEPAASLAEQRFVVAGPQYPATGTWPANVEHVAHLAPAEHPAFYSAQRFTLNITRADMVRAGWSPSVRLFEAAACATPIISDVWPGIDQFFVPGEEILLVDSAAQVTALLRDVTDTQRLRMARAARAKVLREHTAARRAEQLEQHAVALLDSRARGPA